MEGLAVMRWTIGRKLALGFTAIMLLMIVTVALSVRALAIQREQYTLLANDLRVAQVQTAVLASAIHGQAETALEYALGETGARLDYEQHYLKAQGAIKWLKENANSEQAAPLTTALVDAGKAFDKYVAELFTMGPSAVSKKLPEMRALLDAYVAAADDITSYIDQGALAVTQETEKAERLARGLIIGLNALSLVLAFLISAILGRTIAKPLAHLAAVADRVADGDLSVEPLKATARDEIGLVSASVNTMVQNLRELIAQVARSSQQVVAWANDLKATTEEMADSSSSVADVVNQIAQGTSTQSRAAAESLREVRELQQAIEQIAAGAQQQARQSEAVAANVRDVLSGLSDVSQKTADVKTASEQALATARNGKQVVEQAVDAMRDIQTSVGRSADQVTGLGDLSGQIGAITDTITEIAEQTNLLALNAAIEAARAGEQGRGFAVVAEEVRRLAERVASSAREISGLIDRIRKATGDAVESMRLVTGQVDRGAALAVNGGRALDDIVGMVEQTNEHVTAIAAATAQLVAASESVQTAVSEMAAVTEENTAATEQMADSAHQVTKAIETIAATTQQTAASGEEVAASAEELSSGIDEIARSTADLAQVSRELQEQISRFRM